MEIHSDLKKLVHHKTRGYCNILPHKPMEIHYTNKNACVLYKC